jgi:hypothetical protein
VSRAWVIRTRDNMFLRDRGNEALAPGEAEVMLDATPDPVLERYDSTSPTKRRAVAQDELVAQRDDTIARQGEAALGNPALMAAFETTFVLVHAREPSDEDRAAWRAQFLDRFRAQLATAARGR